VQAREGGGHRQHSRIARVDSRDERFNRIVQKFAAEPALHELRDRFFSAGRSSGDERLTQQAQLRAPGKEGRADERSGRGRQCDHTPVAHHVAPRRSLAGIDPLVANAEVVEQGIDGRRGVEAAVRPALEQ